jgi:hypothetical protein
VLQQLLLLLLLLLHVGGSVGCVVNSQEETELLKCKTATTRHVQYFCPSSATSEPQRFARKVSTCHTTFGLRGGRDRHV